MGKLVSTLHESHWAQVSSNLLIPQKGEIKKRVQLNNKALPGERQSSAAATAVVVGPSDCSC